MQQIDAHIGAKRTGTETLFPIMSCCKREQIGYLGYRGYLCMLDQTMSAGAVTRKRQARRRFWARKRCTVFLTGRSMYRPCFRFKCCHLVRCFLHVQL
jgi:hypothetical protein